MREEKAKNEKFTPFKQNSLGFTESSNTDKERRQIIDANEIIRTLFSSQISCLIIV